MAERRFVIEAANRTVVVEGGRIVSVKGRVDCVLRLPGCELRPGLINAHEHLHRNHYGRLGAPPYGDAYEWADDIQVRHQRRIATGRKLPRGEALLVGAWKNLFAGVTTVVHHDRRDADFEHGFPLRVAPLASADSLGMTAALRGLGGGGPFALHLAEGTGARAADEVFELDRLGLLDARCLAVHGVGIAGEGIALFRRSGAALVWCPSSNLFLFGRTACAALLAEGVDVLLGSDSLLTGAGNLLDELRIARETGLLEDRRLEAAVGAVAARRLGLRQGGLEPGDRADLAVLARPLLEASAEDVALVVAGGVPRVARLDLAETLERSGWRGRAMTVGGVTRWTGSAIADEREPAMNLGAGAAALPGQRARRSSAAERTIGG